METHDYTVRKIITAVRRVEKTLVTTDCIWKRKLLPSSHSETNDSSAGYNFHDAVQRAAKSSDQPPPKFCECARVNIRMVLRRNRLWDEKFKNYWFLLFLIFLFVV